MIPAPATVRRVVFLGTPDAAVPALRALEEAGYEIPLVITRADKRRGRRSGLSPSPVKAAALELGIPVGHEVDAVLDVEADLGVVVAYGRLIRADVLERLPLVNVHFSLLPRWRGAAPVERAILAGDRITGVCLMALEEALDTGPVYRRVETPIGDRETAEELRGRLVDLGAQLLVDGLEEGLGVPVAQEGEPTYADKIEPLDLLIDWDQPSSTIDRLIRVGGAWTTLDGRRMKIWAANPGEGSLPPGRIEGLAVGTGAGVLELVEVQPEGKPRRQAAAWAAGARLADDAAFGS